MGISISNPKITATWSGPTITLSVSDGKNTYSAAIQLAASGLQSITMSATPVATTPVTTPVTTPPVTAPPVSTPPPVLTPPVSTPPPVTTPPVTTPPVSSGGTTAGTGGSFVGSKTGLKSPTSGGTGLVVLPPSPLNSPNPTGAAIDIASLAMPGPNQVVTDTPFGTTLRGGPAGYVQEYSQLQAFSSDSKYILQVKPGGLYQVFLTADMTPVGSAQPFGAPVWIPGTSKILSTEYLVGQQPVTYRSYDVATGVYTQLAQFPQFVSCNRNTCHESMSRDGRYTAAFMKDSAGLQYVTVVDLSNNTIAFQKEYKSLIAKPDPQYGYVEPDWANVSPLGNYVLVGWVAAGAGRGQGLEVFDLKTGNFLRQLYQHHNHSDQGIDPSGKECLVTSELAGKYNSNNPGMFVYYQDGSTPIQIASPFWNGSPDHYSMQGPPGIVLCSASYPSAPKTTGLSPLEGEIYAVYFDGSIRRFCHHRSVAEMTGLDTTDNAYWALAKATMSPDGKKIVFASDWGKSGVTQSIIIDNVVL